MRIKLMALSAAAVLAGMAAGTALIPGAIEQLLPAPKTWTVGKATIGGPFELTDHNNQRVSDKTYRGDHLLVFFGFTYCPDVCPAALQKVTAVLEQLGDRAGKIRPLFISVDPERDTPDQLKLYMSNFHDRIVGLTGSPAEIDAVAKAYRAYYRKVKDPSITGEYSMDHSAFLYLMDPTGEFLTHFTHATQIEKMVTRLKKEL